MRDGLFFERSADRPGPQRVGRGRAVGISIELIPSDALRTRSVRGRAPVRCGTAREATVFEYTVPSLGIATDPMSQTVSCGGTALFSVVASGTAPFAYQWRHAGTNLPGATGSTLPIGPVSFDHAGNYDVVVTNLAGSMTSVVAV